MGKAAVTIILVALLGSASQVIAVPINGSNCAACHEHERFWPGATTLRNTDGTVIPSGQEALKVIRVHPGQHRILQVDVGGWPLDYNQTGNPDLYTTAFRSFLNPGLAGQTLKFTPDPAWIDRGGYSHPRKSAYNGTIASFVYNLAVDPTNQPDYYRLDFITGIYTFNDYPLGQVGLYGLDTFYLQVVKLGDINGDNYVNVGDLQILVAHWGTGQAGSGFSANVDLNDDGFINIGDLQLLVAKWGT